MASLSELRRSARDRRPSARLVDSVMASTSPRRRPAEARSPLPQPADRASASASAGARRRSARGPAAQTAVLPDEIWEEILLRLDAGIDLVRASAACSSFHRIVSEHRFLRRFRSLHPPPILGFITSSIYRPFFPAGPPHRSAPEARALEQAADFTFSSFLPDPYAWRFCHARDGRVLLSRSQHINLKIPSQDFVVCDPLHRRYVMIPRVPDDLLAPAAAVNDSAWQYLSPVLAPAAENDKEESFRVICTVQRKDKVVAFVFSSCNQTRRGVINTMCLSDGVAEYMTYYAYGCLFWMVGLKGYSLMLDTSEMKFFIIRLPPHNFGSPRAIVEAADGRLGFLTIGDGIINMYCRISQSNGVGAQEWWLHNKLIPLPKESGIDYDWDIEGIAGHYLALVANRRNCEHFVLDLKTLLIENLCTSKNDVFYGFPYARFPPPLALPSI